MYEVTEGFDVLVKCLLKLLTAGVWVTVAGKPVFISLGTFVVGSIILGFIFWFIKKWFDE